LLLIVSTHTDWINQIPVKSCDRQQGFFRKLFSP